MDSKNQNNDQIGLFTWRELMVRDVGAAVSFYTQLFGWGTAEAPMPDGSTYRMFTAGERRVAGLMQLGEEQGDAPAAWMPFVRTANVKATTEAVRDGGGNVLAGPMEIPDFGSFAIIQDAQGAVLGTFDFPPEPRLAMPELGTFCWESLNTTDVQAALAFYEEVLGWQAGDFGGMPIVLANGVQLASLNEAPPGIPSHWLSYVVVENLADTVARVEGLGGKVLEARITIPGIGSMAVIADPEGAIICPFEGERQA